MPKYVVYKNLQLVVDVVADTPQAAWEQQLTMDDTTFEVVGCDYTVEAVHEAGPHTKEFEDVTHEVDFSA